MNHRLPRLFRCLALVSAFATGPAAVYAAEPDKDWPCVQVKVPELSAGMMWAGPPLEGKAADWRAGEGVEQTAKKLVIRRYTEEEVAQFVEEFAAAQQQADRTVQLTRLFAAAFELVSADRREVITGIERFTRRQRDLAKNVQETRQQLSEAMKAGQPMDELRAQLDWQSRIFEDREKSTKYACEVPTLMEQRLFQIAREIANRIES